jgi:hypothetical protein
MHYAPPHKCWSSTPPRLTLSALLFRQLPINYFNVGGGGPGSVAERDSTGALQISYWSLANMSPGAAGLWAHAVSVWVFSAYLVFLVLRLLQW